VTVSVVHGTNSKPAATAKLVAAFEAASELDGELLLGYPLFGAQSDIPAADAIYLSRKYGAILFDLVEGTDLGDFGTRQDDVARLLAAKLTNNKDLVRKRVLLTTPEAVTFAPTLTVTQVAQYETDYLLATESNLESVLDSLPSRELETRIYEQLRSAIQNISTLRRTSKPRALVANDSRGAHLQRLENQIATLDPRQSKAVLELVEGPQRIRGLAGSGKTIVLALKAAYLHAQHPEWRIAITYNTRSLRDQFRRLITTFGIAQAGEEPDWLKVKILNAWGGRNTDRTGLYYEFCVANGIEPYSLSSAKEKFDGDPFEGACREALSLVDASAPLYEMILIDEAQDLPASFLRLCWEMLSPSKRLVFAYDELQNLNGDSMPSTLEMFGEDENGRPRVDFDDRSETGAQRDIVLEKCYRNSRPVLVTAHAIGFGVYRKQPKGATTQLVQMFDQPGLWEDVGYTVRSGHLEDGADVVLERTDESSPPFLEMDSGVEDLIQFIRFESQSDQNDWVAKEVARNVSSDELRYEDIVVINPNPLSTRANVGPIRKRLAEVGIDTHVAGVDTSADVFFTTDRSSVTFTGVYRAKGNEAGMVYIVNAEEGLSSLRNLAQVRNRLFTAITRSKAWVRVLGVGPEMDRLVDEYKAVRAENFKLKFTYPTSSQRADIEILHREASPDEEANIERQQLWARLLTENLESGATNILDVDAEVLARLRAVLGNEQE